MPVDETGAEGAEGAKVDSHAPPGPPHAGEERAVLTGFLDFQRATVVRKVAGMTDEQARRSLLPSPLTTAAGIVKHLTDVERWWFGQVLAGETMDDPVADDPDVDDPVADDPDAGWRVTADESLDQLVAAYTAACDQSRRVLAGHALDDRTAHPLSDHNVRYLLVQMIEETARHAGHLDVIRELTDGTTGR